MVGAPRQGGYGRRTTRMARAAARRGGAGTIAGLLALGLSGCFVFQSPPSASQQNTIGAAVVTLDICTSGSSGCSSLGNSNNGPRNGDSDQLLVGFRIPSTGVTPPSSFASVSGLTLNFASSASYAAELQRLAPAPAGQRWVGYLSGAFTYTTLGPQTLRVQPAFALAQGANGSPFAGPLAYRPVVGVRLASSGTLTPGRPVSCGPSLYGTYNEPGGVGGFPTEICVDDPSSSTTPTNLSLATEDLGILPAGATASVAQGATATLSFAAAWSGVADPAAVFSISASTTLAGAAVTVPPTLTPPANSTTPLAVKVAVPSSAAPGNYPVTLTASLSNGQTRTATGTLVVTAAPPAPAPAPAPPAPTPPLPPTPLPSNEFSMTAFGGAKDGTITLSLSLPGPGLLDLLGTHSTPARIATTRLVPGRGRIEWGRTDVSVVRPGLLHIKLYPNNRGKQLLAHHRRLGWQLRVRVWGTYTPNGGYARSHVITSTPVLSGQQPHG